LLARPPRVSDFKLIVLQCLDKRLDRPLCLFVPEVIGRGGARLAVRAGKVAYLPAYVDVVQQYPGADPEQQQAPDDGSGLYGRILVADPCVVAEQSDDRRARRYQSDFEGQYGKIHAGHFHKGKTNDGDHAQAYNSQQYFTDAPDLSVPFGLPFSVAACAFVNNTAFIVSGAAAGAAAFALPAVFPADRLFISITTKKPPINIKGA
jgi:hypothetical protein